MTSSTTTNSLLPPKKATAYGSQAPSSEASFRRTWDREAYALRGAAREEQERVESKARYEAKMRGEKYHAPVTISSTASDNSNNNNITARQSRLDLSSQIGKTQILTGSMVGAVGKRGRSAGFYCAECDMTYKDNVQWVEHLNSKLHMINTGTGEEVKRAGIDEVRERLRWLREKREEERKNVVVDLDQRLRTREVDDEREREERRRERRERRRKLRGEEGVKEEEKEELGDVAALMGFGGFGTTKV